MCFYLGKDTKFITLDQRQRAKESGQRNQMKQFSKTISNITILWCVLQLQGEGGAILLDSSMTLTVNRIST